jgi:hypothetical protein
LFSDHLAHPSALVLPQCSRSEEHFLRADFALWHGACLRIKLRNMKTKILPVDDGADLLTALASESVEGHPPRLT